MIAQEILHMLSFPVYLGNGADFDCVFRNYHQPLRYFASRFVGEDHAEDMVENLFLNLFRRNQRLENPAHLQSFLYRAVRNACLDHLKVSRNEQDRYAEINKDSPQGDQGFLNEMIRAEVLAEIYRAVHSLPGKGGLIITLSFLEGLSNAEIAAQLGLSEQTVKNTKVKALKMLKNSLSSDAMRMFALLFLLRS